MDSQNVANMRQEAQALEAVEAMTPAWVAACALQRSARKPFRDSSGIAARVGSAERQI